MIAFWNLTVMKKTRPKPKLLSLLAIRDLYHIAQLLVTRLQIITQLLHSPVVSFTVLILFNVLVIGI